MGTRKEHKEMPELEREREERREKGGRKREDRGKTERTRARGIRTKSLLNITSGGVLVNKTHVHGKH